MAEQPVATPGLKPTPLKTDVAVDLIGVHKWYGDFHVLRDINLRVTKSERIVICGPSPRAASDAGMYSLSATSRSREWSWAR